MNFLKKIFSTSKLKSQPTEDDNFRKSSSINQQSEFDDNIELTEDKKNELIQLLTEERNLKKENDFNLSDRDSLFEDAARLIVQNQIGSTSLLQRRMKLGYNRAGRLMDQLEVAGIVGSAQGSMVRDVMIKTEAELQFFLDKGIHPYLKDLYQINLQKFYDTHKNEIENRKKELFQMNKEEILKNEKDQIRQELLEKERKRKLQREVLRELIEEGAISNQVTDQDGNREPIPQDVMDKVWNRDGGKCVKCGSQKNLEFDHLIPVSKGGATTYRNLQLLCKECNVEKSNKIG